MSHLEYMYHKFIFLKLWELRINLGNKLTVFQRTASVKLWLLEFKEVQYKGSFFLFEFIDNPRDWLKLHKS